MGDRDSNNFLHILEAPGSIDQYKLFRLTGEERISAPFLFHLTLRSQGDIPPASAWINAPITFSLGRSDMAEERRINGRCRSFRHIHQKGSYVEFAIQVAPAFEALTLTRNRRIFTDKSARAVIATILNEHRIAFDDGRYGPSPTRPYIVQQDESDFALVSRLMEDEGVFYHFRFDEGAAPYKHRMFLAGDPSGYYDGQPFDLSFRRDHLLRGLRDLQMGYDSTPGKVVTHDYDFAKPGDLSPVTAPSKLDWAAGTGQVYRYAEDYTDAGTGRDRARLRIEGSESGAVTMRGSGSYVAFAPAARFQVEDPRLSPRERRIVVRSVSHDAFDPYGQDEGEPSYEQQFEAQPSAQTFRPERSTPRAPSRGPQTAVVVDQDDPDGHGRVKVKFHWDVAGASTCWVRVLQQWAGNQMGAQFVPRPGMEVLVDFVEGRADRPVVVGCLYNGSNQHSYQVPANLTQAGFRTFGEGGLAHEFLFEDKSGAEEVYLRSGRDFRREVTNHEFAHVKGLQEVTVDTTSRLFATGRIQIESAEALTLKVGASTIVISPQGVWIDAPVVKLNTGGPSFPVTAVSPPAKAAATAAMTMSGGAAAAPGGGGPAGGGKKVATGDPVMALSGGGGAAKPVSNQQLAKQLVKPGGTATQADADVVVAELAKMPPTALQSLADHKVKVVAAKGAVTDFATDLKGVAPRGWPLGKMWDDVPGAYLPDRNAVVIATTDAGKARALRVPGTGEGHGSMNLVVHEAAHAIDRNAPPTLNSMSKDFLAARTADLPQLPTYERQPGIVGPSETYAESAARIYGGVHGATVTPALDAYWRAHPLGGK
jgi:type VI secretion system secreted protein VgrG